MSNPSATGPSEAHAPLTHASSDGAHAAAALTTAPQATTVDDLPPTRPVAASERISSLDTLRGVAVLGILLMNIVVFGLPMAALENPRITGDDTGVNLAIYAVNHVLFEGKMRTIFSMLFGAGIVLLMTRAKERGAGIEAADVYSRRNLWLLLFGMIHAYLIWDGDILYPYALAGLLLFPFRNLRPRTLIILGLIVLATQAPKTLFLGLAIPEIRRAAAEAAAAEAAGKPLTDEQKEAKSGWERLSSTFAPTQKQLQKEIDNHTGSYFKLLGSRAGMVFQVQTVMTYAFLIWDVMGMMLIGMALLKLGIFTAERSDRFYINMIVIGYAIGVPLGILATSNVIRAGWSLESIFTNMATYDIRRLSTALGHVALVMLVVRREWLRPLVVRLGAVGRMALSNYLATSLICTTIFYGFGFGLYGKLELHQLYLVMLGVWAVLLLWSKPWLARFRFGPFEWLWRSLTYWKRQPMRVLSVMSRREGFSAHPPSELGGTP